jgi:diaminohydroxyphosphoribosylaminopyrimidine deaminase/5-amino-6-(5-phosphoribosylamino)uracil reductase
MDGAVNVARGSRDAMASLLAGKNDQPMIIAQLGQSLDGRIATLTGESRYINKDAALDHLHRLRACVDAVIVGAGTVAADNPQLTVRRAEGRSPARVVIDPSGRLDDTGRWLERDGQRLFLVSATGRAPRGAELIQLSTRDGLIPPADIVAALAQRGLRRLLIEGGARTISAFIDAGCVDRLHILMAPVIIGSGVTGLNLAPIASLTAALRPRVEVHDLGGGETLFDCVLRESGQN